MFDCGGMAFAEANVKCFTSRLTPVTFPIKLYFSNIKEPKERDMSQNHYTTKAKRRNRSGKRKDTRRIAANMAKIKELERKSERTK